MSDQPGTALEPADPRVLKALEQSPMRLSVGDIFIDSRGSYLRVSKIYHSEKYDKVYVSTEIKGGVGEKWRDYGTSDLEDFCRYHKSDPKLDTTVEEFEAQAQDRFAKILAEEEQAPVASDETALVQSSSRSHLERMKDVLEIKSADIEAVRRVIARRVDEVQSIVSKMLSQIGAITRILGAFELYLGLSEEIYQIREGAKADLSEPITIHQQVLFMDEEVGIYSERYGQRGIDFQRVEEFDAWIVQPEHLAVVMPEQKGIVAFKPSRQHRHYHENPWVSVRMEAENAGVYLLCRNGDCLYRIWTGTSIGSRLIPGPDELSKDDQGSSRRERSDKDFTYRRNVLLLQGLLDRTPIFVPMAHLVSLGHPETYGDLVRPLYDDEPSLADGVHIPYWAWHKQLNSQIERGTRILLASEARDEDRKGLKTRFLRYYSHESTMPPLPKTGVYTVEDVLSKESLFSKGPRFVIRYNPGDQVYTDWWRDAHTRKHRLGFYVKPSDQWVLNYDKIDLETIEWYIGCRYERRNYLHMLPVLFSIRRHRLEELAWEKDFVALVAHRQGCDQAQVWEAVAWWKSKVIWKRPISQDDAKALRMVEQRVKQALTD